MNVDDDAVLDPTLDARLDPVPKDADDPLGGYRDLYLGAESELIYLDGNSLGRPLAVTVQRLERFVLEQWAPRLIRGWGEQWFDLPLQIGDRLGRVVLGAAEGQTVIGDSTTVWLYKLLRAAVDAQLRRDPTRTEIVIDTDNFPTDRYVAEGVAAETGCTIVWIEVARSSGVSADQLSHVVGERTNTVLLSHVAYRSGHLADMAGLTAITRAVGALVLWDLSHSVGSVDVRLDECGVDLAVGCTYKYLNGGPGAPAFGYVAARHHGELRQPIQGWVGHADSFEMGPIYTPADGIRGFLSGTPPIMGMLALQDTLDLLDEVGIEMIRTKSVELTDYALQLADAWLVPLGVTVATPRDPAARGSHLTLSHPRMKEVVADLWKSDVLPDYREPEGLRLGLSPLSTSFAEVYVGMRRVRDLLS